MSLSNNASSFGGLTWPDGRPLSKRDLRKARGIIARVFEHAVRTGEVDLTGKSEVEIHAAYTALLDRLANVGEFWPVIDRTRDLLQLARKFAREGDARVATLFYATWVEHWINSVVSIACERRGLPADEVVAIVRDSSLKAKTGWLLRLLGLKRIAAVHRSAILRLADLRNAFVHYKWKPMNEQALADLDRDYDALVKGFPKTVTYLQRYENEVLFAKAKRKLRTTVPSFAG